MTILKNNSIHLEDLPLTIMVLSLTGQLTITIGAQTANIDHSHRFRTMTLFSRHTILGMGCNTCKATIALSIHVYITNMVAPTTRFRLRRSYDIKMRLVHPRWMKIP